MTPSQHPILDCSDALHRKLKKLNPYKQFVMLRKNVEGQGPHAERAVFHAVLVTFALINRGLIAEFCTQETGISATQKPKRKKAKR